MRQTLANPFQSTGLTRCDASFQALGEAMRRRQFIAALGSSVAWPLAARAQQPALPLVGSLYSVSAAEWQDNIAGFRLGLGEAGFVDGRNVKIEYRWANGHPDLMPKIAADLVGPKCGVRVYR